MTWTNYHSHCHYCDGKEAPEKHLESAIEKGLICYGFSSHTPVPFDSVWNMKNEDFPKYLAEINALKKKYEDQIEVYVGLETDYVPGLLKIDQEEKENLGLDYTVGSIHFTGEKKNGGPCEIDGPHNTFLEGLQTSYEGDVEAFISRYFELTRMMLKEACPDVLGHMDKIKMQDEDGKLFSETANWYQKAVLETLEEISNSGVIVEVNTRGVYKKKTVETYPSKWILEHLLELKVPIMLNSDSHVPSEITSYFGETAEILQNIGFKELMILKEGNWQPAEYSKDGLKL
ncbi:histidinol-phosphatase [Flammeovirgaceae bacterium SG7u.111]|nr:histidinol-phosphatase [Flammeovirgaceae bacterium SG7u.132]WPO37482.1 histidinol-phosphatase [Flammeovirgaceae bacterium SG7u.111]